MFNERQAYSLLSSVRTLRPPARGFIGQQEANYIHLLLGHPEPKGKEAALELLCAHYRKGRRLRDPHGICQTLPGLLYNADPHVRRWTFNAIALVGNKAQNLEATLDALERNRGDDDIFAAGMAALIALTSEAETEAQLKQIGVELEGAVLLAAAQQATSYNDRLAERRVHPDQASASELRLAAVLVGLGKAPEHLFSLGHVNAAVIGSFYGHHDKQVAQYAAWAVCEHPDLNLSHLGFSPSKLRDQAADVRKYGFRLLTADDATAEHNRDLVAEASFDTDRKAREGLAIGLAQSYFPGLEEITLEWHGREADPAIKEAILDHFVAHADRTPVYEDSAKEAYRRAPVGSILRAKLEARAEGKPIFREFRKIDYQATSLDLFGTDTPLFGTTTVTKNISINAQNVGVVADTSNVQGGVNQTAANHVQQAQDQLASLLALLDKAGADAGLKQGKELAAEARAKPTKGLVEKVIGWMGTVKTATGLVVGGAEDFAKIADKLQELLPYLPQG
ncbi:hypothetical protein [Phenylobacterium sp.]|uniref:hypothetical protein n=1 Tax=Phenylobacterium sp. TaxID=1871053 RepID=UPI00273472A6|nr:hypothetical protein [Phenylobacterium sp.]MDP3634113.1 hypothetical protein [Phenylobacterium sp.]